LVKRRAHQLDPLRHRIELDEFRLREFRPSDCRRRVIRKTGEQLADLVQAEAGFLCECISAMRSTACWA